ncbi:uncharacterized protein LOC135693592 [Rhopilema esculentum]|uniref:uncharacterized protein LOC135693592 n=1 Tax=Rhopilema esculentum TaxID=499914 RepID=UPI0031DEB5A9|eukprot:gene10351-19051_t
MSCKISLVTVEPVMFFGMLSFFLNMVAMPQMILDNVCLKKHNETKCAAMYTGLFKEEYDTVQGISSLWFSALLVAAALVAVLLLPFIAALSDEFGRRKIMSLTPLGQLLQSIVIVCILSGGLRFPTWLMVLVGLLPGMVGDICGLYVITSSYIADVSSVETRTLRINLLESAAIISALVASLSSGYIIEHFGYIGAYIACIITDILELLYIILLVKPIDKEAVMCDQIEGHTKMEIVMEGKPIKQESDIVINCLQDNILESKIEDEEDESTKKEKSCVNEEDSRNKMASEVTMKLSNPVKQHVTRKGLSCRLWFLLKKSNPVSNFTKVVWILKFHGQLRYGMLLFLLMACAAATYSGELSVMVLYLKNRPFYMGPVHIGYFLAFQSAALSIIGLIGVNYLLTRVLKLNDHTILLLTATAYTIYCVLLGLANSTLTLYLVQLVHVVSTVNVSTIRAMVSKITPPSTVSIFFSAIIIVESFAVLVGSIISPLVYYAVVSTHPGSVFFINAFFMFFGTCVSLRLFFLKRYENQESSENKVVSGSLQTIG